VNRPLKMTSSILLPTLPFALALAGCVGAALPERVVQSSPGNYRTLAAAAIVPLPNPERFKNAVISDLQASAAPQPADWFACVRLSDGSYLAAFYDHEKITDMRRSVGFDRCDVAPNYVPLPPPEAPKKPRPA